MGKSNNFFSNEQKALITRLFFDEGKYISEIKEILGLKYHQPIYNYLEKDKRYKPHLNGNGSEKYRKYTVDESYFDSIDTEQKAYILGFITADAHIAENRIQFTIKEEDVQLLKDIKVCMKSNHPIKYFTKKSSFDYGKPEFHHASMSINSIKLTNQLRNLGLTHDKTYTLNTNIINHIPQDLITHFARGYYDGNGGIYVNAKIWKYVINIAGNKDFLLALYDNNFETNNSLYYFKKSKQTYGWRISNKSLIIKFCKSIYKDATIFLKRKHDTYINLLNQMQRDVAYLFD